MLFNLPVEAELSHLCKELILSNHLDHPPHGFPGSTPQDLIGATQSPLWLNEIAEIIFIKVNEYEKLLLHQKQQYPCNPANADNYCHTLL